MATAYIIWDRKDKAQVGGPGSIYLVSADASAAIRDKVSRVGKNDDSRVFDVVTVTI